jgi:DNA polymerase I-like protein with 3'-5' exonuclease and polymerase domains
MVQPVLDSVKDLRWIFHNAQFDLFHLRRWAKIGRRTPDRLWDTMIIERLMWGGYFDGFSLDDLARRYLDVHMDKKIRKQFEDSKSMTSNLIQYAALDAYYTFRVHDAQLKEMNNNPIFSDVYKLWTDIEGPVIETVQNFRGFTLDQLKWSRLALENEHTAQSLKDELDFNPASPKQVKEVLNKRGYNLNSTAASILETLDDELANKVLDYRKAAKMAGTYGANFITDHMEDDGKIYAHYWTIGAATGRFSSADPNMQNIPHDERYRQCFRASPGCKLIVADYSQQEPRITACESRDENLINAFMQGIDVHLYVARLIFDDPNMVKSDPRRYYGKQINLGLTYGLTATGLANRTDLTRNQASKLIRDYFRNFSGVEQWISHQHWLGENNEYVKTRFGRLTWLNPYNYYSKNVAVNAPIQGGAADQTKLALILLEKRMNNIGLPYPVVAVVHDEIVAEAQDDYVDVIESEVYRAMMDAGDMLYPEVPWKVGIGVGTDWTAKA